MACMILEGLSNIITAKAMVATLNLFIPKSELTAILLSSRLANFVCNMHGNVIFSHF